MEAQLQEMEQLLHAWNLPQLCATFREQEITPEALDALTETDLEILIPKLGPRALFRKRLHAWLQMSENAESNETTQPAVIETIANKEPTEMAYSYVDEDDNEVEVLSEVWLNEEEINVETTEENVVEHNLAEHCDKEYNHSDVDEIAKNVLMEDKKPKLTEIVQPQAVVPNKRMETCKNLTKKPTQVFDSRFVKIKKEAEPNLANENIVEMEVEALDEAVAQEINVTSSIQSLSPVAASSTQRRCQRIGHNWAGLNVEDLLLSTEAGRSLLERYESNPVLDKRARYYLAEIIVTETFAKNLIMDRYKFDNIASQIVQLFPTEDKESWYSAQKSSKKCSGGTLYYKYYATYTKMRKNGFYQHYMESVSKNFDSDASLSAEIENGNYPVKLEDIGDDDPYKNAFKRSIPRYERIRNSSDFERINVKEVLEKTYEGLGIVDFYEKNGTLDVATRNRLCKIVCMEGINRNIKMQPSDFYDISCQVVELFPNEKHEVFFFPRGKTPPKGCLYHKYIYLIRRMKKMGLVKKETVNNDV